MKMNALLLLVSSVVCVVCAERNPFEFVGAHKLVEKPVVQKTIPVATSSVACASGWQVIEETPECLIVKHADGQIRRISLAK